MLDFVEPAPSPTLISVAQRFCPLYAHFCLNKLRLVVDDDVRSKFAMLKGKRTIICPNHPSSADAAVLFMLSAEVGEQFEFMTAREIFGSKNSFQLKWMQKLGCYSVERGTQDVEAFSASRHILEQSTEKIVIFPEGEISYQNDHMLELQTGTELIAIASIHRLRHQHSQDSIFILPLSLRYRYSKDVRNDLLRIMGQIEDALGIQTKQHASFTSRIRHSYEVMLDVLELAHEGEAHQNEDLDYRLSRLRNRLISEVEGFVNLNLSSNMTPVCKIHLLVNAFADIQRRHQQKLAEPQEQQKADLSYYYLNLLKRVTRLISVGESNFNHTLTQEEAAELLDILVQETCKMLTLEKPDVVYVSAAEVIDVKEFQSAHSGNTRSCMESLRLELEHRLSSRLTAEEKSQTLRKMD